MTYATTLKQLFKDMLIDLCNTRDFDSPFITNHLSPGFAATHADAPPTASCEEFLSKWQKIMTFMPDFFIEIPDIIAKVNEEGKKRKMWVLGRMSGLPGGRVQESVEMMEWEGEVCISNKDVQRLVKV